MITNANLLPGDPRLEHGHHGHHAHGHHDHQHLHNHNEHSHDHLHDHQHEHGPLDHKHEHKAVEKPKKLKQSFKITVTKGSSNLIRPRNPKKIFNREKNKRKNAKKKALFSGRNPFRIPRTSFSCKQQAPGYYADMDMDCQVYHMCTPRGGRRAFFCPEGTKFNQRSLVCDHERNVQCSEASSYFHRNIILHQESVRATGKSRLKGLAKSNLQKRPRLENSNIVRIKQQPNVITSKANGRLNFAPLFQQRKKSFDIASFTTTTTSTATTTTTSTERLIKRPRIETGPQQDKEALSQLDFTDKQNAGTGNQDKQKLQLLPHKEASDSVARFHKDPEESVTLDIPPQPHRTVIKIPSGTLEPPLSPVQFVGHVMTPKQLKAFPNSRIININGIPSSRFATFPSAIQRLDSLQDMENETSNQEYSIEIKETSRSSERGRSSNGFEEETSEDDVEEVGLPIQLNSPGRGLPAPLVWISPASLARSPMVSLRRLDNEIPVQRTLTMRFPSKRRKLLDLQCFMCLNTRLMIEVDKCAKCF